MSLNKHMLREFTEDDIVKYFTGFSDYSTMLPMFNVISIIMQFIFINSSS